jgi:hypothetical protein
MGDSSATFLELQKCRNGKASACCDELLGGAYLYLDKISIPSILNHIDHLVNQSRGNESVEVLALYPYAFKGQDEKAWDKVGEAVGNLQALKTVHLSTRDYRDHGDYLAEDDVEAVPRRPIPDWEILARILTHVRQNVTLVIDDERLRTVEEVQPFARAIHGHPFITSLQDHGMFPYESLEALFSTLATLPALESVTLGAPVARQVDESTLAHPESLTDLLRVPTLRSVRFHRFSFTSALFQATANALIEGTAITKLEFIECFFFAEESIAILANGLSRNTSVISISVVKCNNARALYSALAAALPSNSTLQHLELGVQDNDDNDYLPAVFLVLGNNGAQVPKSICVPVEG